MKGWCGATSRESPPEQPYLQASPTSLCPRGGNPPLLSRQAPGRVGLLAGSGTQTTAAKGRWEPAAATCLSLLHHLAAQQDVHSLLPRSFNPVSSAPPLAGSSLHPPLLLHQVRLARGAASPDAEAPRPAAKRGFTHTAAERRDSRTNLKRASRKASGWGIYGMRNKEARAVEGGERGKGDWKKLRHRGSAQA